MDLQSTYNQIAEDYFKEHKNNVGWLNSIYSYLDKFIFFLKPEDLVLDVGCGPGFHSKYLISKGRSRWIRVIGRK